MQSATKYVYTERKNNVYVAGDVIEWNLSPVDPFINTKELYIAMEVQLQSTQYKLSPSAMAGLSGLIRVLTVSAGDGTVLESISNYGLIYATRNYYENTDSIFFRKVMHEGLPNKNVIDDSSCNQYLDATAKSDVYKRVEVLLPLYLSGCLSPDRSDVFPNIATKGLNIKIDTSDVPTSLMIVKAPLYKAVMGYSVETGTYGGYAEDEAYLTYAEASQGDTLIVLKCIQDSQPEGVNAVLSANVENPAHLFMVGQYITVKDRDYKIENITVLDDAQGDFRIVIKLVTELLEDISVDDPVYVSLNPNYDTNSNYNLSNVRMNINTILPGHATLKSMQSQIESGNYRLNIFSFTDYPVNISTGSKNNSLKINCRNTMATGVICLPQNSINNNVQRDSYQNDKEEPYNYNFLLYNAIAVPSKLVDLRKFNDDDNKYLYNAVALREMHKALTSCKWQVNNLLAPKEQWFVGRELAKTGFYYNCNNELTLNINYVDVSNILMHCVLCHEREIICSMNSIQVII